jgi:hypothetical protein
MGAFGLAGSGNWVVAAVANPLHPGGVQGKEFGFSEGYAGLAPEPQDHFRDCFGAREIGPAPASRFRSRAIGHMRISRPLDVIWTRNAELLFNISVRLAKASHELATEPRRCRFSPSLNVAVAASDV